MPVGKSASGLDEKEKKNSCAVIHFLLLIWIYNIYHNLCSYRQIYKIKALKIHQFFYYLNLFVVAEPAKKAVLRIRYDLFWIRIHADPDPQHWTK